MDRIKRKLKLFDIKYYDIDDDIHIIPSINQHIKNQEKKHQEQSNLYFNEYNSHKPKTKPHNKENDFFIYRALLAIEETAIFIIEKTPLDYFYEKNVDYYHA